MQVGDYCVVYVYLDKRTNRITATARLDRQLDNLPPRYSVGQAVDLLVVERTEMGFKAIIEGKHWGLIHKNEAFVPPAACANRATSRNCARTARSP